MLFIVFIMFIGRLLVFIGRLIMFNACFSTFGYVMAFVFVEESRETREYQNKWQQNGNCCQLR